MLPTEAQLVDYFIFDAEDIDVGTFSRAKTDEVAAHFKIDEKAAYRALNVLAKKGVLTKTRDIMKRHKGKHAVGFQWWEYGWKPEDRERHAQRQTHEVAMARKTRREPEHDAHAAGADYANEQLAGSYFQDWVWKQMVEAERMRAADPSSVLPLETPADARKVARNMLQQLGWDTKRELKESKEFFEGFDEVLQSQSSIDWLADMILDFDKEAREKTAPARKTRREPEHDAHAAGADYAREQLAGAYFQDWVWEQMVEAERMRAADPSSVLPLETPADARKVAKNMLQQLEWDTKRDLNITDVGFSADDVKEFYAGFDEVLRKTETRQWLADMILDFDKEAREGAAPGKETREAKRGRSAPSSGPQWVPPALARDGITPVMLEVLLHGMGEHSRRIRAGNSVVYDRAYTSLKEMGYVVMKRATPGLSSFGDYFVLTDKGADVLNRYRVEVRKLAGKTEARESRRPTRRFVAPYYSRR